ARAGDLNGDGIPDMIVGDPSVTAMGPGSTYVMSAFYVFTGPVPMVLTSILTSVFPTFSFGDNAIVVDDVDLDGVADFVVFQSGFDPSFAAPGNGTFVSAYSGAALLGAGATLAVF